MSADILFTSLNEIALDLINNIKIQDQAIKGNHMGSLASDIVTYLTNNKYYLDKCSKVVEHLSTIMHATTFSQSQSRESMWYIIIVNNEDRSIHNYFIDTLLEISKHLHAVESGFLFHLCERVTKQIICTNVKKKDISTKETLPISEEEKAILYYVSGYIIFSMIEKYKRIININKKYIAVKDAFKFLNSLKTACSEKVRYGRFCGKMD